MRIDALTAAAIDDAAALMAREHRHVRDRGVPVSLAHIDAATCGAGLRELVSDGGFVARRDGRTVGVMCGRTFGDVGFVPAHGLAVAPDAVDPTGVVAELFAALAPVLVADGAVRVTIDQLDHEGATAALFDLGFGRGGVFAVRDTSPIDVEPAAEVRVGNGGDLDSIAALGHVEFLHRSMPPMYVLEPTRTLAATRSEHERLFDEGAIHLLAARGGHDVGLLTIERNSPAPRLCAAGTPYIGSTATKPDARRTGVGRSLLSAALRWSRAHGHDSISVDFDSRSPVSRPFWLDNGFCMTGSRVRRVLLQRAVDVEAPSRDEG